MLFSAPLLPVLKKLIVFETSSKSMASICFFHSRVNMNQREKCILCFSHAVQFHKYNLIGKKINIIYFK